MGIVVVVAGGTGLVGSALVELLCDDPDIERVVCLGRRAPTFSHAKLEARIVPVLTKLTEDDLPKDAVAACCALGTTKAKAGSNEAFRDVDERAVLAFARAARARGVRRFVLVSSQGADERSISFYFRVKGQVERELRALAFDVAHVVRPSLLRGARSDTRLGEAIGGAIGGAIASLIGTGWKYAPIEASVVASAMRRVLKSDAPGFFVHEADELRRLGAA